jgi:long-chain acyl-CoA synthetase
VPISLIAEAFRRVCRDRRDAVAVCTLPDGHVKTFDDLFADFSVLRDALHQTGVDRGATVVSLVGNRPVFFPLFAACMDLGAALVAVGDATDAEAIALVQDAHASAVVTDRELALASRRRTPVTDGALVVRLDDPVDPPPYGESVVLKLTSGSTDFPKAAIALETHLMNDGRHIIEAMGLRATDVNFTCIPLSHSYAIGNVVIPLIWQGTATALRQSFSPAQFAQDVTSTRATVFPGVPFMFDRLKASAQIDRLPDSLRLLITAGARADIETVVWFRRELERKIHSFYGTSETGGISYDDTDEVGDSVHVGHPMPETTVTLQRSNSDATAGRIFVQGNAISYGYAGHSGDYSGAQFNGSFLTGDLGLLDDHGRLVLTGRASMLVNVAGRKVDPSEVERTLLALPGIVDARVLGMPCDVRGQQVVAFVVRRDASLTTLAIRRRCAGALSPYKIPRRFVFLDQLPVDARGKIDRRALEELATDRR